MRMAFRLASSILCMFLLPGCYETRQEFTLNPDHSGKVVLEAFFDPENFSPVEDKTAGEKLKDAVRSILEESKGVEAWKDVAFRLEEDGRAFFRGTAYFREPGGLKFRNLGNAEVKLEDAGAGGMKLEVAFGRKKEEGPEERPSAELSDEETAKELAKAKSRYAQKMRPVLVAILADMKEDFLFHLPGSVGEGSQLRADAKGDIPFRFEGARVIEAMDRMFEDDDLLRRKIKSGDDPTRDGPSSSDDFEEMVFGMPPPFGAVLPGPLHPLFDYRSEVAAARKDYAAMTGALGIVTSVSTVTAPSDGSGFKALTIGAVEASGR